MEALVAHRFGQWTYTIGIGSANDPSARFATIDAGGEKLHFVWRDFHARTYAHHEE